jgi:hypothetical protein
VPMSRPPSSNSISRDSLPPSSSSMSLVSTVSSSSASSKRKKSQTKSYRDVQDDESDDYDDGADADAEWVPGSSKGSGASWANVNVGERRSKGRRAGSVSSGYEDDVVGRRHSMAV